MLHKRLSEIEREGMEMSFSSIASSVRIAVVLATVLFLTILAVQPAAALTLTLDPASRTDLTANEYFTIDFCINNPSAEEMSGFELYLTCDPTIFEVVDIDEGGILTGSMLFAFELVDKTNGVMSYSYVRLGVTTTESGTAITTTFKFRGTPVVDDITYVYFQAAYGDSILLNESGSAPYGFGALQPTETPTEPATETPTDTATYTPTDTATATDTATSLPTDTPTITDTATPLPTDTPTITDTATPLPTDTATYTYTPTDTPTDTATHTYTPTDTATDTATPLPTDTPTATDTATAVPTDTPTATDTATPVPTDTPTATDTPTITDTATPLPTETPTPTDTATPVPTNTPTITDTPTDTATYTYTPTDTSTNTPIDTATYTYTNTNTATPTDTSTPEPTDTPTNTNTPTPTATVTDTPTVTSTPTDTATPSDCPCAKPRSMGFWKNRVLGRRGLLKFFPDSQLDNIVNEAVSDSTVFSTQGELEVVLTSRGMRSVGERAEQELAALLLNLAAGELYPDQFDARLFSCNTFTYDSTTITVGEALTQIESKTFSGDEAEQQEALEMANAINNGMGVAELCGDETPTEIPTVTEPVGAASRSGRFFGGWSRRLGGK